MRPRAFVTITDRDASRLAEELEREGAATAAAKIRSATQLSAEPPGDVELEIGEDETVLRALESLRQTGDFSSALERLTRELQAKIDREG